MRGAVMPDLLERFQSGRAAPQSKKPLEKLKTLLGIFAAIVSSFVTRIFTSVGKPLGHGGDYPATMRSMEIQEAALGTDHPDNAQSLSNLVGLLEATGPYERAEPLYRQALTVAENMLGTDHPHGRTARRDLDALQASAD